MLIKRYKHCEFNETFINNVRENTINIKGEVTEKRPTIFALSKQQKQKYKSSQSVILFSCAPICAGADVKKKKELPLLIPSSLPFDFKLRYAFTSRERAFGPRARQKPSLITNRGTVPDVSPV